jgi:hypothetical protein
MNLHKSQERTHGVLNDPDMKDFMIILLQEPFWSAYTKECPTHQSWIRYEPTNKLEEHPPRAVTYINKSHLTPADL